MFISKERERGTRTQNARAKSGRSATKVNINTNEPKFVKLEEKKAIF